MMKSSCNEFFIWLAFLLVEAVFRVLFVSSVPETSFLSISFKSFIFAGDKSSYIVLF